MEIIDPSFVLQIWPTISRKMSLTILKCSTLRYDSQMIDCNHRFRGYYFFIFFLHARVVFHRNIHGTASISFEAVPTESGTPVKEASTVLVAKSVITINDIMAEKVTITLNVCNGQYREI